MDCDLDDAGYAALVTRIAAAPARLTTADIAAIFGVTSVTARRWFTRKQGGLAGHRVDRQSGWRATRDEVARFAAQRYGRDQQAA